MDIFISYSHKNKNIVDSIDATLSGYGVKLIRDIRDLEYTQSIKEFMKKNVKKSDYVLMLISNFYLKSKMCMYEVMELLKDDYYTNRILPIITSDSYIFDDKMIFAYYTYWKNKYTEYSNIIDTIDKIASVPFIEEFKIYENIVNNITRFLFDIRDRNCILVNNTDEINLEKLLNKLGIITGIHTTIPTKTILLVDDNLEFRNTLEEDLKEELGNYRIISAPDGREALEIIKSMKIDLIVTDIIMPNLDGIGLLEKMRKEGYEIPTIVLSAVGQDIFVSKALSLGASYYLVKPFDLNILIQRIQNYIDIESNSKLSYPFTINELYKLRQL